MANGLEGATQADIQPIDPATGQVIVRKAEPVNQTTSSLAGITPDMTSQDPNTFAALTAHNYLQTTYAQGLSPTGDKVQDVFSKALSDANEYHRKVAEDQAAKNLELQTRAAAVTSGLLGGEETARVAAQKKQEQIQQIWQITPQEALGGESPLTAQKKEEAAVEAQKTTEIEQRKQGPDAYAAWIAAGRPASIIQALPDKQAEQVAALETGYQKLNDLQTLHSDATNSAAFGGFLKTKLGGLITQPGITSDKVKNYFAAQHAAITPLAVGLLGDTARAATMPGQQENLLHNIIPDENDNIPQAGQKIFLMKKNMIDQLQSMRDNAEGKYATTRIDALLGKLHSDYDSQSVQQYNPFDTRNKDLITVGQTPEGQAQVAAGATKGVQAAPSLQGAPTPMWAQTGIQLPGASGTW